MVVDAGKVGLPHTEAVQTIQRVLQLDPSALIQKFHGARSQLAACQSSVLPFPLLVSYQENKPKNYTACSSHRQKRQPLAMAFAAGDERYSRASHRPTTHP